MSFMVDPLDMDVLGGGEEGGASLTLDCEYIVMRPIITHRKLMKFVKKTAFYSIKFISPGGKNFRFKDTCFTGIIFHYGNIILYPFQPKSGLYLEPKLKLFYFNRSNMSKWFCLLQIKEVFGSDNNSHY